MRCHQGFFQHRQVKSIFVCKRYRCRGLHLICEKSYSRLRSAALAGYAPSPVRLENRCHATNQTPSAPITRFESVQRIFCVTVCTGSPNIRKEPFGSTKKLRMPKTTNNGP